MICRARVSTRSVLSPVNDRFGRTKGSTRTNSRATLITGLPRKKAMALRSGKNRHAAFS